MPGRVYTDLRHAMSELRKRPKPIKPAVKRDPALATVPARLIRDEIRALLRRRR
jgi:hypothetical protein